MSDHQVNSPFPPQTGEFTVDTAKKLLARFVCADVVPVLSMAEKEATRAAVLFLVGLSDYQTLGICADTVEQGRRGMEAYVTAFVRPITLDLPPTEGPIYLKFNTQKGRVSPPGSLLRPIKRDKHLDR